LSHRSNRAGVCGQIRQCQVSDASFPQFRYHGTDKSSLIVRQAYKIAVVTGVGAKKRGPTGLRMGRQRDDAAKRPRILEREKDKWMQYGAVRMLHRHGPLESVKDLRTIYP
jgi:hypothetical protein